MEPGSNLPYFRIIESLLSADYLNQQKQNLFTKMFGLLEYFSPLPLLLLLLLLLLLTNTFGKQEAFHSETTFNNKNNNKNKSLGESAKT